MSFAQGGCRPTDCSEGIKNQYKFFENLLSTRPEIKNANLIYHQSGSHFVSDQYRKFDSQLAFDELQYHISEEKILTVKSYLEDLASAQFSKVIWLGPFIEYRQNPEEIVLKSYKGNLSSEHLELHPNSKVIFNELEQFLGDLDFSTSKVKYIAFDRLYKVEEKAIIQTASGKDCFQFRDRDHFSHCGEKIMSDIADWSVLQFQQEK